MFEHAAKRLKMKENLSVSGDERTRFLAQLRSHQSVELPYKYLRKHAEVGTFTSRNCKTLILTPHENPSGIGVLYLYGGGFLNPPRMEDYKLAVTLMEETGCDIYFPLYPLFPDHVMHETVEGVIGALEKMAGVYPRGHTAVLGFSSGASLCIYTWMYLMHEGMDLPMPERWLLNSPVLHIPTSDSEAEQMRKIDAVDPVLPSTFFTEEGLCGLMYEREEPRYRYLADPLSYTLSGIPRTDLWYGTHEVLSVYMNEVIRKEELEDLPVTIHEGTGLMHCWGLYSASKESRETRKEYITAIRELAV